MSWNVRYESRADFEADKRAAGSNELGVDCQEQFDVARPAAKMLVESGAVGDTSKDFTVTLAGHANPSHEPRSGWANDTITVTIYQKPAA